MIFPPKRWTTKPPLGVQLQSGNSLSSGLVAAYLLNEGGGLSIVDSVRGQKGALTNASWRPGTLSVGTSTAYAKINSVPVSAYPLSFAVRAKLNNLTAIANSDRVLGAIVNTAGLNEFWFGYFSATGASYSLRAVAQQAGVSSQFTATAIADTNIHSIVVVFVTSVNFVIYLDGKLLAGSLVGAPSTPTTLTDTYIGGFLFNTSTAYGAFDGEIEYMYVYNRSLMQSEAQLLHSNPYLILQSQSPQRLFLSATVQVPFPLGSVEYPYREVQKVVGY